MAEQDPLTASIDTSELPDMTESMELVTKAQGGDDLALGDLFDRYQARLRRIVRIRLGARLRERVESMDIVQNTYEVAFRKIGDLELRSTASILQWLSKIAENKIRDANDFHFAFKRHPGLEVAMDDDRSDDGGTAGGIKGQVSAQETLPPDKAWKTELRELLDDAMAELPDDYREVIILRDYCGGEWEYVTQSLGRSNVHATQEMHRRAWIKLRRLVRPKLGGLVE